MNMMFTCVDSETTEYSNTQIQNNAFGLSAPQLYRPIRMFVTRDYRGIPDPCIRF